MRRAAWGRRGPLGVQALAKVLRCCAPCRHSSRARHYQHAHRSARLDPQPPALLGQERGQRSHNRELGRAMQSLLAQRRGDVQDAMPGLLAGHMGQCGRFLSWVAPSPPACRSSRRTTRGPAGCPRCCAPPSCWPTGAGWTRTTSATQATRQTTTHTRPREWLAPAAEDRSGLQWILRRAWSVRGSAGGHATPRSACARAKVHACRPPGPPPPQSPGVHARGHQGQAGRLPLLRPQQGAAWRRSLRGTAEPAGSLFTCPLAPTLAADASCC